MSSHYNSCDHCVVRCPFASQGCASIVTHKTFDQHLQSAALAHTLLMARAMETMKVCVCQPPRRRGAWARPSVPPGLMGG